MRNDFTPRDDLEKNLLARQSGGKIGKYGIGIGISVKPDLPVGLKLEPAAVQQFMASQ